MMLGKRMASTTSYIQQKYKVVVVGGGSGGLAVASQLSNKPQFHNKQDILIIDPAHTHYYQPLWTFVGAGLKNLEESGLPMMELIPKNAAWLKDKAVAIHTKQSSIKTSNGSIIEYEYLVVAPGMQLNWDSIPGLVDSLNDPKNPVASNYSEDYVNKTNTLIQSFTGGNAIFTQPATPVKCAGAPQKIMYLAEEIIRKNNFRKNANMIFNTGMSKIFSVDKYGNELFKVCNQRGIAVNLQTNLVEIKPDARLAVFKTTSEVITFKYDFMHVTPPMSPPSWLKETSLTNKDGWINIDKKTLQHQKFPNIFALGDASSLPTSKTAAAACAQSGVLVDNLVNVMRKKEADAEYEGYTSCPLITGKGKLILAEFDYDLKPQETFPFDQSKERASMYHLVSEILPTIYWKGQIKGYWKGPPAIRKALRFGK